MSEPNEAPPRERPDRARTAGLAHLRAVWPFALTFVLAVGVALLLQLTLPLPGSRPGSLPGRAAGSGQPGAGAFGPTPTTATAAPAVTPSSPEVAALRNEINRLWSAYYLARAASQLADAEAALRINDLNEVELVLTTVSSSLERAYDRSPEQDKGPISEFRLQVGRIHADLRVRPEGLDQRLRRLRQSMLSLFDEGG